MNRAALTKHEIWNNLAGFTEKDLNTVADFIDFMRYKNRFKEKKVIKLKGILKEYDIDFSDLKKIKKSSWEHVDKEFRDE